MDLKRFIDRAFPLRSAAALGCVLFVSFATEAAAAPIALHVSPKGNDAHEGSAERPLATLEKARDLLRPLRNDAAFPGAVVHVHAGNYVRAQPFALGKQDSGRKNAQIVYRAQGTVSLIGGKIIPHIAFRPVSDPAVKARLPQAARDQVRELHLPSLGIKHCERFPESFTNSGGIIELLSTALDCRSRAGRTKATPPSNACWTAASGRVPSAVEEPLCIAGIDQPPGPPP